MSYVILKSDGTILTTIADGTINTTSTPLGLPGRLYPGYGQVIDTDVVHLLENFANSSPPTAALRGQLWFNTTNSTLNIAPSDSPAASAWLTIATTGSDGVFGNLTITGNITANNAAISNNTTSNTITVNYATVNVSANITNANVTGNFVAANVLTNLISTGAQVLPGQMIGTWTVSGGQNGNSLYVNAGNLVISNAGYGIKTDLYMYANGQQVSFNGTYTNSNVAAFLPVYVGDIGLVGGGANLNGNVLNTGSSTNPGTIIGNWTIQPGSNLTGLTNVPGSIVTGIVANANTSLYTVNVLGINQPNIVSVGTLTSLNISGSLTSGQIISTVTTGTPPLTVLSNTKVSNLNADLLDGYTTDVGPTANTIATRDAQGNVSANYFLGNGALLTGINNFTSNIFNGTSNINIATPNGNIVASVNGTSNILTISTVGANILGTVTATAFVGDGSRLTNIPVGNISGTISNANYASYAGNIINSSQPNITSIGTLTSLNISGNLNAGNVISSFFGSGAGLTNIPAGNIIGTVSSAVSATSASTAGSATTAGTVTTNAQPNITSVGTLTSLNVSGRVNAASFAGDGSALTNLTVGNISGTISNANYAAYAGNIINSSQPNITSIGTLTSLNVTGNITGSNISGNHYGNGFALTNINGSNVSGTVALAVSAGTANTASTVTTAAQPNITSLGILSGLGVVGTVNVTGTMTVSGNSSFATGTQQVRDIIEQVNLSGSAISGSINVNLIGPSVNYFTTNAAGNWAINFIGNNSVTVNSYLGVGQSATTTVLVTIGSSAYYPSVFSIDGVSVTPKWLGGSAPSSGSANKVNVYTFTIVKTGSSAFTVFASVSNYG